MFLSALTEPRSLACHRTGNRHTSPQPDISLANGRLHPEGWRSRRLRVVPTPAGPFENLPTILGRKHLHTQALSPHQAWTQTFSYSNAVSPHRSVCAHFFACPARALDVTPMLYRPVSLTCNHAPLKKPPTAEKEARLGLTTEQEPTGASTKPTGKSKAQNAKLCNISWVNANIGDAIRYNQ